MLFVFYILVAIFHSNLGAKRGTISLKECGADFYIDVDRIFGGQDAEPLEFPHQASLRVRHFNSHVCGGTIINDRWVMTAAHCFIQGRHPSIWKIVLGEHNLKVLEQTEREFLIDKVIIHEKYDTENQLNDIALLKLMKRIDLNGTDDHLKPICLASEKTFKVRDGMRCVATGWGRGNKGSYLTDILQKLNQPVLDSDKCAKVWKDVDWPVTKKHVCAGDLKSSREGVCNGDSGGPLQCQLKSGDWLQIGIASWTNSNCVARGYAAVFTRVSSFRFWINEKINQN